MCCIAIDSDAKNHNKTIKLHTFKIESCPHKKNKKRNVL